MWAGAILEIVVATNWPQEVGFYWCKQRYKGNDEKFRIGVCEVFKGRDHLVYVFNGSFLYPSESDVEFGDKIEPSFS